MTSSLGRLAEQGAQAVSLWPLSLSEQKLAVGPGGVRGHDEKPLAARSQEGQPTSTHGGLTLPGAALGRDELTSQVALLNEGCVPSQWSVLPS